MSLSFGFASLHEKRRREKLGQRDSKCRASYEGPLRDKSLQGLAKTYNPYKQPTATGSTRPWLPSSRAARPAIGRIIPQHPGSQSIDLVMK
jgi:hypothetical protein